MPIKFKGKLINTYIQKGGNQCIFFATLYAKRIAETGNVNAYQQVNGAFIEKKLQVFEDIDKIDSSLWKKKASSVKAEDYLDFMRSWVRRCSGHKYDRIKEIPLLHIANDMLIKNEVGYFYIDPKNRVNSISRDPSRGVFSVKSTSGDILKLFDENGRVNQKVSDRLIEYDENNTDFETLGDLMDTKAPWLIINGAPPNQGKTYLLKLHEGEQVVLGYTDPDTKMESTRNVW